MTIQSGMLLKERYQIHHQLGGHGVAFTYMASDTKTDQPVIVKELSIAHLDNWKSYELFKREINVLKQLKHPAIPQLIDAFKYERDNDFLLYVVLERVPGQSLENKLNEGWHPNPSEVIDLAKQALNILKYLHKFRPPVIHRDIKPSNLVLDEQGRLFLIDFGAVQEVIEPTGGSTVVGTFGYMPVEQFSGQTLPASDLYALGATLVHLLSGIHPSELILDGMELQFNSLVFCHVELTFWLEKLVKQDVNERFKSAEQALQALLIVESHIGQGNALIEKNTIKAPAQTKHKFLREGELLVFTPGKGGVGAMISNVWVAFCTFAVFSILSPELFTGKLFGALGVWLGLFCLGIYGTMLYQTYHSRNVHTLQMNFTDTFLKGIFSRKKKMIDTTNISNVTILKDPFGFYHVSLQTPFNEYKIAYSVKKDEAEWIRQELLSYVLKVGQNG